MDFKSQLTHQLIELDKRESKRERSPNIYRLGHYLYTPLAHDCSPPLYDYATYCLVCESDVPAGEPCACCPGCGLSPCEFDCTEATS